MTDTFKAFLVSETDGRFEPSIVDRTLDDLPPGDVVINVEYSSLNYKDALSASGNKGVTRNYPHTPGIDAAGSVESSIDPRLQPGDPVIVMGYDLGMNTAGGFAGKIRVPSDWVIRRPKSLSAEDAMVFGTAGFTAAMCVDTLLQVGIAPEQGPVLVTGATGGVGIVAVWLLRNMGFDVVASTGKSDQEALLKAVGATSVISREALLENAARPMNKPQWAAVVDTVGGAVLSNVIKSVQYGGSVACCGLVGGNDINTSVFPFILRGVNLLGVDSVELPLDVKQDIWNMIGKQWMFPDFATFKADTTRQITLPQLPEAIAQVLKGQHLGRYVVKVD
ncbi:MAG TPA: oxidoreductase [Gammaproteobacteria bacterium]|nr:oxidoreductase [Pseudomonadales bacterium]HAG94299.1 oxidoreductase [Gammaproteobacteria bacterium]HAU15697.1 oxidoreductase [Gammaproteobacteria bacterium]HBO94784.1 oxidoreductase [Gammaproteobacteria bacterium]|tara:strand:- start:3261 stop:4265 length:1005 start_codon:yes stop_codon:yes gene_type:complete